MGEHEEQEGTHCLLPRQAGKRQCGDRELYFVHRGAWPGGMIPTYSKTFYLETLRGTPVERIVEYYIEDALAAVFLGSEQQRGHAGATKDAITDACRKACATLFPRWQQILETEVAHMWGSIGSDARPFPFSMELFLENSWRM
jgi:hypothetical protein